VLQHPVLFQIGVQASWPAEICLMITASASTAWQHLPARTERLAMLNLLGARTPQQASVDFHAMCEGLTSLEMRGLLTTLSGELDTAVVWRRILRAVVAGFAAD
jgi:hypothetical protein